MSDRKNKYKTPNPYVLLVLILKTSILFKKLLSVTLQKEVSFVFKEI